MVSYLYEISMLGYSEIQELADLVEDVEGCSKVKDGRVLQRIIVN